MTQLSTHATALTTFVVRFWREWSKGQPRWRGRVEHVQSGQGMSFLAVDEMVGFFRMMGVSLAAHRPTRDTEGEKDTHLVVGEDKGS
jgi:hypothetical protein